MKKSKEYYADYGLILLIILVVVVISQIHKFI
jgi:hypothetical protein